jgi:flagellar capping protein FliD
MSTLRLPGLVTGIDTAKLIEQMMAIERRSINLYEERKSVWEERQDALSTLESKLSNLRNSVRALSDADTLRAFSISSSDIDKLTADSSNNAFEGNHNVVINQLATSERWIHTTGKEYDDDLVGAGTFIYSYNNKETIITTTATTTLTDLVGLINNDANNPGVTASLLYYNNAYHLVLNGNDAGSDYRISINAGSTEVWQANSEFTQSGANATLSTKITSLDQFSGAPDEDDVIEITGKDHYGNNITQVDLPITSNTKLSHLIDEINDAFDGIAKATLENGKIVLTDKAAGASSLEINLNYNHGGDSSSNLEPEPLTMAVLTGGNSTTASGLNSDFEPGDFTQTQSAQNSLIKVDGYPSDSAATSELQTMSRAPSPTGGTYTLTYEGQTTAAINYDAAPATIQAALEALSTVNTGDITVGGGANGLADGDVTFTFSTNLGDVSMIYADGSNLVDAGDPTVAETTKGVAAYISRSSNTVDDVIYGVALHLHDTTDASGEELTLTRDIQSVKEKINSLVDSYNFAVQFIQEKTGYNDVLKTAGILMGDYVVSTIQQHIRSPIIAQTNGFIEDIDSFLTPGHLGLNLDREGILSFDVNEFDEAIAEDYLGVLALIGADKTGSSDSNTIEFYGAHSDYTTAGSYDVEVVISGGAITSAKIKLSTESTHRNATISGNIITGISTFDDNGDPVYPENSLQLSVDLSQNGTFNATVRVKEGFAGAIEDALDKMLKVTTGSIQIDQKRVDDQIEALQDKIEREEDLLTKREERLIAQFSRLEKTLALIQQQMSALGFGV